VRRNYDMRVLVHGINKHGKSLSFKFEGKSMQGVQGDSIASALINNGVQGFRGTESNEKRGLFCGMGVCNECLVKVNSKEGILACMTPLNSEMDISVQPQHISVPDFNNSSDINSLPEIIIETGVLVIGAGPAGMTVSTKLAKSGVEVLLIDERKSLGGQYFKQPSESFEVNENKLDLQYRKGRALIRDLHESGAKIFLGVKIWAADGSEKFFAYDDQRRYQIKTSKVIIATGAFEKGLAFPGWTLPGVMTTGAGQSLLRSYQVAPGNSISIAGNGPLNIQLAAELLRAGANVKVIAESSKILNLKNVIRGFGLFIRSPRIALSGAGYILTIFKYKTKFLLGQVVISANGSDNIEEVNFAPINSDGKPVTEDEKITCIKVDSLTLGYGFMPANEIARILGCEHKIDGRWGYLATKRNLIGATDLPNVWVIGDGSGINGAQVAKTNADLLALEFVKIVGIKQKILVAFHKWVATIKLNNQLSFQKNLWQIFKSPVLIDQIATDQTNVCRCLSITLAQTKLAISGDTLSAGAAKRINRVGMGRCQGRYCSPIIQKLIADSCGIEINEYSGFAPQIPIKPVEIGIIANSADDLNE